MIQKHIIEFIHELGDGGASALVKDYSLLLTKDGYKVCVVVVFPEPDAVTYKNLRNSGIEIVSVFQNRNVINRVKNKFFDWYYIPHFLKGIIEKKKPAAVHAHLAVLRYLAPIYKTLKNTNVLFTCHSLPSVNFEGENEAEFRAANKLLYNNHLRIIALHEDMKNELNRRFGIENVVVVKNGIDFMRYKNIEKSAEQIRQELNIPVDAYVIGHIGRFSKVKNHEYLVLIFKRAKEMNDKAFLLLVGTGELIDCVRKQLADNNLTDSSCILSHRSDIPELLKSMDVLCVPSLHEGFSLVTLEAQVVGIPCVVADTLPKQVLMSKNISVLSLEDSIDKWAETVLDPNDTYQYEGNIGEYDMNLEIKKLEELYVKGNN